MAPDSPPDVWFIMATMVTATKKKTCFIINSSELSALRIFDVRIIDALLY